MGVSVTSLFGDRAFARKAEAPEGRALIVLWMNGGPSQLDTFDLKPGTRYGGPFKPIPTRADGIEICEHLPKLAEQMNDVALIRSMNTPEGSHERGRYLMHTGYLPLGTGGHPCFGSIVSAELGSEEAALPNFVSVTLPSIGPGLLGMSHAAFHVPNPAEQLPNIDSPAEVTPPRFRRRLNMLGSLERDFVRSGRGEEAVHHARVYRQGVRLMRSPAVNAFDVSRERAAVRDAYGRNAFGQGCLLARRLVEAGVSCVEVTLNGWDTHLDNFNRQQQQMNIIDPAITSLLADLRSRGLRQKTLIAWLGEFGRTPKINILGGRDHWPGGWTAALAGAGIRGGTVVGQTSRDGTEITDRPVTAPQFFATLASVLGIDPAKENLSGNGRPLRLVDHGEPVREILR